MSKTHDCERNLSPMILIVIKWYTTESFIKTPICGSSYLLYKFGKGKKKKNTEPLSEIRG